MSTVFVTAMSAHPLVPQFVEVATGVPIVTVYACVEDTVPFVTLMTKGNVPVATGVPETEVVASVEVPSVRPIGSVPEAMDHANGPVAVPVAISDVIYGTVVVPFGSDAGRMASVEVDPPPQLPVQAGAATVMVVEAEVPGFWLVEDADSPTVARFVTEVPAGAVTCAAIRSVAVEDAGMSPIVHAPVELA